ncbi:MAG: S49 family peptidase [Chloroflexi bacterium]|nr:S49 family peptidase [Chloroflexota bacterium]
MQSLKDLAARPRTEQQNQILIWLAVALAAALTFYLGFKLSERLFPRPKIGIVYIDTIISGQALPYFSIPLTYALEHDDVAAVVLVVNSPGGSASTSEELYFRAVELRDAKPVVTTVTSINASGAYYMSVGTNYIIAKPAALVGSIGVVSGIPAGGRLSEFEATTGPFKGSGSTQVDWIRGLEAIKNSFVGHVYDNRLYLLQHQGDGSRAELLPDARHLATGQVWFASDAYQLGVIDALGSDKDAIAKAAELAHVANYEIVDLTGLTLFDDPNFIFGADMPNRAETYVSTQPSYLEEGPWPTFYHLYLPPTD